MSRKTALPEPATPPRPDTQQAPQEPESDLGGNAPCDLAEQVDINPDYVGLPPFRDEPPRPSRRRR